MTKKNIKKGHRKGQRKVVPIVIDQTTDADLVVNKVRDDIQSYLTEVLMSRGFTENQIEASSKEITDYLSEAFKDGVAEVDDAQIMLDASLILVRNTVGYERLLTDKEIIEYLQDNNAKFERNEFGKLGVSKKDIKRGISTILETVLDDVGIIREKVENGLFKVIRDNWGADNLNELIQADMIEKGKESEAILKDKKIKKFYEKVPNVTLELILRFAEGNPEKEAEVTNVVVVGDKNTNVVDDKNTPSATEEVKNLLRRINPQLTEQVVVGDLKKTCTGGNHHNVSTTAESISTRVKRVTEQVSKARRLLTK